MTFKVKNVAVDLWELSFDDSFPINSGVIIDQTRPRQYISGSALAKDMAILRFSDSKTLESYYTATLVWPTGEKHTFPNNKFKYWSEAALAIEKAVKEHYSTIVEVPEERIPHWDGLHLCLAPEETRRQEYSEHQKLIAEIAWEIYEDQR